MKFELKTENENYSKSISYFLGMIFILTLIIISSDVAFKLRIISRNYEIDHKCRLLSVEKSANNFKELSRLSNLKTKQSIWEFCKGVLNNI